MPESPKELLRILGQLDAAQSAVDDPQSPPRVPAQVGMFGLGRRCRDVAFVHAPTVATSVDGPAGLHRRYIMQPASLLGPPSPVFRAFQSCVALFVPLVVRANPVIINPAPLIAFWVVALMALMVEAGIVALLLAFRGITPIAAFVVLTLL
jgi:hypothetical protein